jgi:peptidoglycan/LPS O-acetylase OafA/YrhL
MHNFLTKIFNAKNSIASYANNKQNNFDLLRLIAAVLVVYSHSYPLTGIKTEPFASWSNGLSSFGGIAVACFFLISGFLITKSYTQRHDLIAFLTARILRIFPALIVAVLFCAFIIGPMTTDLPWSSYFSNQQTYRYITHNSTLRIVYELPGVFIHNLYPIAVNGSLWTLPLEFAMYIGIAVLGVIGFLKKTYIASGLTLLGFVTLLLLHHFIPTFFIFKSGAITNVTLNSIPVLFFILGMLAYLHRDKIILHPSIALILIITCLLTKNTFLFGTFFYMAFAYCILFFAFQHKIHANWLVKRGDISYGVYIYAFPLQQAMSYFFHITSAWLLFAVVLPPLILLAVLSWHFIEKKALKLKNILPTYVENLKVNKAMLSED